MNNVECLPFCGLPYVSWSIRFVSCFLLSLFINKSCLSDIKTIQTKNFLKRIKRTKSNKKKCFLKWYFIIMSSLSLLIALKSNHRFSLTHHPGVALNGKTVQMVPERQESLHIISTEGIFYCERHHRYQIPCPDIWLLKIWKYLFRVHLSLVFVTPI